MTARPRTLVIGASRGVGRATALELARRGHDIALAFQAGAEAAKDVAAELPSGTSSVLVQGDVATDGARIVDEAVDGLGGWTRSWSRPFPWFSAGSPTPPIAT